VAIVDSTGTVTAVSTGAASILVSTADGNKTASCALQVSPAGTVLSPVFTPSGGNYQTDQTVILTSATTGASIFYTVDGTDPSVSSTRIPYVSGIPVSGNGTSSTIKAVATKAGLSDSAQVQATFTISYATLPLPLLSPSGGVFTTDQSVTISEADSQAILYYSTDGSAPTGASSIYASPIAVSGNGTVKTIKVFARKSGALDSSTVSATYTINNLAVSTPQFTPAPGVYTTDQTVRLTCPTSGATLYFTTDGSTPTTLSTIYSAPIPVAGNGAKLNLNVLAVKSGLANSSVASGSYNIQYAVTSPVQATPASGTYSYDQTVILTTSTQGATIFFTTDGSAPTTSSPAYSAPIPVCGDGTTATIRAFATAPAMANATATAFNYQISYVPVQALSLSPSGYTYSSDQTVSVITATTGATIYYTLDGSTPTASSTVYTAPISIAGNGTQKTIKAVASKAGMSNSAIVSATYTIAYPAVATPQISAYSYTYSSDQTATISCSTTGATIYCTVDGSTPNSSSPVYSSSTPISVSGNGTVTTIKAYATKAGMSDSAVASSTVTISYPKLSAPGLSAYSGAISAGTVVTFSDYVGGVTYYFTTDGSVPTTASTTGSSYTVNAGVTLKVYAVKTEYLNSDVTTATYTTPTLGGTTQVQAPAGTVAIYNQLWQSDTPTTISLSSTTAYTFYASCNFTPAAYQWLLDNAPIAQATSATLTVAPSTLTLSQGTHWLTSEATDAQGVVYSQQLSLFIVP
jgi:hypothetical protein